MCQLLAELEILFLIIEAHDKSMINEYRKYMIVGM